MLVSFLKILGHSPDKLEQATLQELVSWGLKYKTQ